MRLRVCRVLAALVLAATSGLAQPVQPPEKNATQGATPLALVTLLHGRTMGPLYRGPAEAVERVEAEFRALWRSLGVSAAMASASEEDAFQDARGRRHSLPAVDFSKSMVVAVMVRGSPTLSTGVKVDEVLQLDDEIVVRYREYQPSASTYGLPAIGAAYHLVAVPRSDLPVRFERTIVDRGILLPEPHGDRPEVTR
jgi:hypothetical protein